MERVLDKRRKRQRRKIHIRKRIRGSAICPRMTVFRSNRHTYVQVIDDDSGRTIASVSNMEKELRDLKNSVGGAAKLGEAIGKRLQEKKIASVVFDRNGYRYHGIVKGVADGARKVGIDF